MRTRTHRRHASGRHAGGRHARWLVLAAAVALAGCGVVAAPFRVTGAVVKAVPVVGHPVAAPLDATGDAID